MDGLRAVAVLAVVLYHAFPTAIRGGFVGVDVFFVISGFLISRKIMDDLACNQFGFVDFYTRRVRRIFPALIVVLLACLGYGLVILLPAELAQLGRDIAGGAGFVANVLLWQEAGYFDRASASKPLLHLWSLGVEEQFYILWPLILWAMHRSAGQGRTRWKAGLGVITAASFCLNLSLAWTDPIGDFYSPLTRLWELSSGALLAWAGRDRAGGSDQTSRMANAGSCIGAALIVAAAVTLDPTMRFPGVIALIPVAGTLLLIAAEPAALVNRRLLSSRVVVWMGLMSYPLYLWHWPLISFATIIGRGQSPKPAVAAALVLASLVLAWLTWWLIECPVRRVARAVPAAAVLTAAVAVIGLAGVGTWKAGGFASRDRAIPEIDVAKVNAAISDGYFKPTPSMHVRAIDHTYVAEIGSGERGIAFVGDSLIYQFGPRIEALLRLQELRRRVLFVVGASCPPVHGIIKTGYFAHCSALSGIARQVIADESVDTVILGAFWPGLGAVDQVVERDGHRFPGGTQAAIDAAYANLEDDVRAMVGEHRRVFLVLTPPVSEHFDPKRMISRSPIGFRVDPAVLDGVPATTLIAASEVADRRVVDIAGETGARIIAPMPDVCGTGPRCLAFFSDGEPKYADDKHMRPSFVGTHITAFDTLLTR